MLDGLGATVAPNGNINQNRVVNRFNHLPGGSNVLWLDGHVEFIKYPGKYPVSHYMALETPNTGQGAGVNVQRYIDVNPTLPQI
jgi:prepilin-type processing-associated H-X9-DG protein